jgi:hypothetical protein
MDPLAQIQHVRNGNTQGLKLLSEQIKMHARITCFTRYITPQLQVLKSFKLKL